MAAFNNRLDIAKLLLRANCKIGMRCRIVDGESSLNMTAFRCAITKEHWDFIELLIQAGYDLKEEDYLWSNTDIPTELILNLDMWTRLIDYVQTPLSLIFSCRNKIRNVLRRPLEPKIYSLPLPTYLKEFLLLKKLWYRSIVFIDSKDLWINECSGYSFWKIFCILMLGAYIQLLSKELI